MTTPRIIHSLPARPAPRATAPPSPPEPQWHLDVRAQGARLVWSVALVLPARPGQETGREWTRSEGDDRSDDEVARGIRQAQARIWQMWRATRPRQEASR